MIHTCRADAQCKKKTNNNSVKKSVCKLSVLNKLFDLKCISLFSLYYLNHQSLQNTPTLYFKGYFLNSQQHLGAFSHIHACC